MQAIVDEANRLGISIGFKPSARDLGVMFTGGGEVGQCLQRERIAKRNVRAAAALKLRKLDPRAKILTLTGPVPMGHFGQLASVPIWDFASCNVERRLLLTMIARAWLRALMNNCQSKWPSAFEVTHWLLAPLALHKQVLSSLSSAGFCSIWHPMLSALGVAPLSRIHSMRSTLVRTMTTSTMRLSSPPAISLMMPKLLWMPHRLILRFTCEGLFRCHSSSNLKLTLLPALS